LVDTYFQGVSPGLKRRSLAVGSHLEQKHEALNHLFGFIPTAVPVAHRPLEARSTTVQKLYEPPKKVREDIQQGTHKYLFHTYWIYREFAFSFECNLGCFLWMVALFNIFPRFHIIDLYYNRISIRKNHMEIKKLLLLAIWKIYHPKSKYHSFCGS
jgi:hypothetical protein